MDENTLKEFKKELSDLLNKYNCSIDFEFEGDTQGMSSTQMVVYTKKNNKSHTLAYGFSVDAGEISYHDRYNSF